MGIGKSFLISLVAFVGLNFVFTILYYALEPVLGFEVLINEIQNAPLMIVYYLFGSIASIPSSMLNWIIVDPLLSYTALTYLIMGLGFIVAPLIAAILAGRLGEGKYQGFVGWLLTVIVSAVAVIIGIIPGFSTTFVSTLTSLYGWSGFNVMLISLGVTCIVNMIFYGFFALLVSKTEYY